jgi:membrane protein YqaA with SNARE-associated domain
MFKLKFPKKLLLQIIIIIAVVVLAIWLAHFVRENEFIQSIVRSYGYFGVLFIALVSGLNLFVPIPTVIFLPVFVEAGLSQYLTLFIIAVCTTLADTFSYFLGKIGRKVSDEIKPHQKLLNHVLKLKERYYIGPIIFLFFFAAFSPFPNEILVIILGFLHYRLAHLLPALFVGNLIFNSLTGAGILRLFNFF